MQPTKQLPKEGRKKGWHLPFPWLWNPTGSKLFEVLSREETVIASILKRREMSLYTDHGSSDLSREGRELAVSRRCGWLARRNRNERSMCQSWVGPGKHQEEQGAQSPAQHFSIAPGLPLSQCPAFLSLIPLTTPCTVRRGSRRHLGLVL